MKNLMRFRQGFRPNKSLQPSYCATTLDENGKPVMKSLKQIEFASKQEHGPRRAAMTPPVEAKEPAPEVDWTREEPEPKPARNKRPNSRKKRLLRLQQEASSKEGHYTLSNEDFNELVK